MKDEKLKMKNQKLKSHCEERFMRRGNLNTRKRKLKIDAEELHYRTLNEKIREAIGNGYKKIVLENVCGQRYIGDGLTNKDVEIIINGIPGNDMAAFMDGPKITVNSNTQDGVGNTMNSGEVIIHGDAGDILGHSMRGGKIFVKGSVGYRVGIHMKAYKEFYPVIVVGQTARDFLGEYMAGGLIIVLGINTAEKDGIVGDFVGTGMHGGMIYLSGEVGDIEIGKEIKIFELNEKDKKIIKRYINEFCNYFHYDANEILKKNFLKLLPSTHRPYGNLYAY